VAFVPVPEEMTDLHDFVAFRKHTRVRKRRLPARNQDRSSSHERLPNRRARNHHRGRRRASEALRKDYAPGIPHGDEKAGGAVAGGVIGAVAGAVVGGPVGAVVVGAIGAATGATAGAVDQKSKDDTVVVRPEEQPL
jgi:hypothetical protein